jgi:hypothetical protein
MRGPNTQTKPMFQTRRSAATWEPCATWRRASTRRRLASLKPAALDAVPVVPAAVREHMFGSVGLLLWASIPQTGMRNINYIHISVTSLLLLILWSECLSFWVPKNRYNTQTKESDALSIKPGLQKIVQLVEPTRLQPMHITNRTHTRLQQTLEMLSVVS